MKNDIEFFSRKYSGWFQAYRIVGYGDKRINIVIQQEGDSIEQFALSKDQIKKLVKFLKKYT